jgi:NitT/TauT family transport system substrate-binding protein
VHLLADHGFNALSTTIEVRRDYMEKNQALVQRFVDATIEGWIQYLNGDASAANAMIKRDNPEMTDALLAYGIAKLKQYGIVDSGDSLKSGIGAMTEARWKAFYEMMSAQGLYPAGMDYKQAYTLRFVNQRVGLPASK